MNEPEQMMTNAQQIEQLQKQVRQLKDFVRKKTHLADLYMWLLDKEILLATPEGFKHLQGEGLTDYIKAEMAKDWGLSETKLHELTKGRQRHGDDTRKES